MTGPPTPPITSAIEIEDAARAANAVETPEASGSATATTATEVVGSVPVQAVSLGTPEQAATPFRRVFATLAELAAQGKFQELVEEAEVADLSTIHDDQVDRILAIAPLVLSYLVLDDAASAIQAIMRLPDILKVNPIIQALFKLAASVSERKYQNVYLRVQGVQAAIQSAAIPGADLLAVASGLLDRFVEAFRTKTLVLLSKGYSSVLLSSAQAYLGCAPEQVLHAATQNKWKYDVSTHVLSPVPIPKGSSLDAKGVVINQSGIDALTRIVNSNLE